MSDKLMELPEKFGYPDYWITVSLSEACHLVTDGTHHSPPNSLEGEYPYITAKNIKSHGLDTTDVTYVSQDVHKSIYARCPVEYEDVLYIKDGVTTGLAAVNHLKYPFSLLSSVALLKPIRELLDPYYLKDWLNSPIIFEKMTAGMTGSAIRRLVLQKIRSTEIPLPPLNEQKRIVAKIEELRDRHQRAKQALETIPELCDRFRQSVLAAAFRGDLTADWREENPDIEPASVLLERIRGDRRDRWERLELEKMEAQGKVPKNDQWKGKYKETTGRGSRQLVAEIKAQKYRIEDLPDTWTAIKLGEVLQVQTGYAFKSQWFVPDGVRLLRGTNIVPGSTRWEDVVYLSEQQAAEFEEFYLLEEDIVIAMDRPVISTGLKIARLNSNDLPALLLQRVGRFKLESGIDPDYLFGFLNSQLFLGHVQDQATGTQLPHISANDIESAIMPLPPVKEQEQISKMISAWMLRVNGFTKLVESASIDYARIQQSILAKAFRGELVEQDPNDEPASVLLDRIRAEREKSGKSAKGRGGAVRSVKGQLSR